MNSDSTTRPQRYRNIIHSLKNINLKFHGMRVKVIDATSDFVSFKYLNSNARKRIKRDDFIKEVKTGMIDVINPEILGKN